MPAPLHRCAGRRHFGCPIQYSAEMNALCFDGRRMELQHVLPFLQAAMALGYASQSCFNQAFRRWTSTTPTSYRQDRRRG